jgi:glutamyl-tRNA synthetase/glutamyl-Q tRNA(Asp) synthetase
VTFEDALLGPATQSPHLQCGDLLARDRAGHWTYQFAVVVDDLDQGVNVVIRGEDLLASTGRQVQLAELLGRPDAPTFLHHPLILDTAGVKLSKSRHDTGVRELRAQGLSAATVRGLAAAAVGIAPSPRDVPIDDLPGLFA